MSLALTLTLISISISISINNVVSGVWSLSLSKIDATNDFSMLSLGTIVFLLQYAENIEMGVNIVFSTWYEV